MDILLIVLMYHNAMLMCYYADGGNVDIRYYILQYTIYFITHLHIPYEQDKITVVLGAYSTRE